jgi:hypothetical protein
MQLVCHFLGLDRIRTDRLRLDNMVYEPYITFPSSYDHRSVKLGNSLVTGGGRDVGVDGNRNRYSLLRPTYRQVLYYDITLLLDK